MPLDEVKQSADKRDSGTESETHFIRYTVNADMSISHGSIPKCLNETSCQS